MKNPKDSTTPYSGKTGKASSLYEPYSKYETEKHIAYREPKPSRDYEGP